MRRCLCLLCLLWWGICVGFVGKSVAAESVAIQPTQITGFPCQVGDTPLLALGMGTYEGLFYEDGSERPEVGAAALLIKNTSEHFLQRGAAVLYLGSEKYVFEVFALPAGETAFVCEAQGRSYPRQDCRLCDGWAVIGEGETTNVTVEETAGGQLRVTNETESTLKQVRVRFKTYDEASGMYIGGVCYESQPMTLLPGESRVILPQRYVKGYSRVVQVLVGEM